MPSSPSLTELISIQLEESLWSWIQDKAALSDISASEFVREAVMSRLATPVKGRKRLKILFSKRQLALVNKAAADNGMERGPFIRGVLWELVKDHVPKDKVVGPVKVPASESGDPPPGPKLLPVLPDVPFSEMNPSVRRRMIREELKERIEAIERRRRFDIDMKRTRRKKEQSKKTKKRRGGLG